MYRHREEARPHMEDDAPSRARDNSAVQRFWSAKVEQLRSCAVASRWPGDSESLEPAHVTTHATTSGSYVALARNGHLGQIRSDNE